MTNFERTKVQLAARNPEQSEEPEINSRIIEIGNANHTQRCETAPLNPPAVSEDPMRVARLKMGFLICPAV